MLYHNTVSWTLDFCTDLEGGGGGTGVNPHIPNPCGLGKNCTDKKINKDNLMILIVICVLI